MIRAAGTSALAAPGRSGTSGRSGRHAGALIFVGEMYGLQLDQLAAVLGVTQRRASAIVAGWNADGLADAARLGPGQRWGWLTRAGLASRGLPRSEKRSVAGE